MTFTTVTGWAVQCPECESQLEFNYDPTGSNVRCSVCGEPLEIQTTKRQEGDSDGLYWQTPDASGDSHLYPFESGQA